MVHGSPRFSEDLDFDNHDITRLEFETLSEKVEWALGLQGYPVELKLTYGNAFRASLRFPGVLYDNSISPAPPR